MTKKAMRIVKGVPYHVFCSPFFKELGVMTMFIYLLLSDWSKKYFHEYQIQRNVRGHNTRNSGNLNIISVRLEKTKKSMFFIKVKLFHLKHWQ